MTCTRPPAAPGAERGQTLIEGALALLVFFSLLLAVIDCGMVLVRHQSLVERVRSAVRWGVVRPWDGNGEQIANLILYDQPDEPRSASAGYLGTDARQRPGELSTALGVAPGRRSVERVHRQLSLRVLVARNCACVHQSAPGGNHGSHGLSRCRPVERITLGYPVYWPP